MTTSTPPRSLNDEIAKVIQDNPIVLFMKGTPQMPMCGFSGVVCQVLDRLGQSVHGVNVLDDPEMREGIKAYTNWPTLPQLYISGEFIGGADIVKEMYMSGELAELLKEKGFTVKEASQG